jgi:hypothetical protein
MKRDRQRNRVSLLCFASLVVMCVSQQTARSQNPLVEELLNEGVTTADGTKVRLPLPMLTDGMTAEGQRNALAETAKSKRADLFYSGSITSPFSFSIKALDKLTNKSQVRQIDVLFIAKGSLDDIENKELLKDLGKANKKVDNGLTEEAAELTEDDLKQAGLPVGKQEDGSQLSYGTSQTNLLDKVYLDIVTVSQTSKTDESITLGTRLDQAIATATGKPSTWQAIARDRGKLMLAGPKSDYFAAGAYAKATELKHEPGSLLIEFHVLVVEPYGWFQGVNLLSSKLPPLIQDSVRTFRRKLAEAAQAKPAQ